MPVEPIHARVSPPLLCAAVGCVAVLAVVLLPHGKARAQPPVAASKPELQASWHTRYEQARDALIAQRYAQAEAAFHTLASEAQTTADRRLASELEGVASSALARQVERDQPELRTPDELAVLYTTAVFYGLGTAGWIALQVRPQTFGGALLPFAIITPATVGVVALADNYRPLRHGIPHAIAAGLYLGFGEGLWLSGYQHTYASRHSGFTPWHSERVSTLLWASSTVGAVAGGLIGAVRRPTPGRVSFTASAGIWTGLLSAFAASAIEPLSNRRAQRAYLVGTIGYNAGLLSGIIFGPSVAPSVARVRFIDLGGLFGALLGGGGYALVSSEKNTRGSLGAAAIGGVLGLGIGWWATSGMPADRSHDYLKPAIGAQHPVGLSSLRPSITPLRGGFMASVSGAL